MTRIPRIITGVAFCAGISISAAAVTRYERCSGRRSEYMGRCVDNGVPSACSDAFIKRYPMCAEFEP